MKSPRSILTWTATACAVLALAACGGSDDDTTTGTTPVGGGTGGQTPQPTTSATVTAWGTVTGFGSVVIDGRTYDDRNATVTWDTEAGAPDDATGLRPELRLGQRVVVAAAETGGTGTGTGTGTATSDGTLSRIAISPELVGTVTAIAPNLVVAGQRVLVNADTAAGPVTVFEGFENAASIAVGDRIEVHGMPTTTAAGGTAATPAIAATRIERKPVTDTWVRVAGTVSGLASDGTRFELGGLPVRVVTAATATGSTAATRVVPGSTALANGQRVVVWSTTAVDPTTGLTAAIVRVQRRDNLGGGTTATTAPRLRISGPVTGCTPPCAGSFQVGGVTVNAAGTAVTFSDGMATDLANGRWVEVTGALDETGRALTAERVVFRRVQDPTTEVRVRGTVSDYVSPTDFQVLGVPVTTTTGTQTAGNCPNPLVNGAAVSISGRIEGDSLVATRVECPAALDGFTVGARGTVTGLDAATRTFTLGQGRWAGYTVRYADATTYDQGTATQLANGAGVEVHGTVTGTTIDARRIEFLDARRTAGGGASAPSETRGIVTAVTGGPGTGTPTAVTGITVNGANYAITPQTVVVPNGAALAVGREVRIAFTPAASGSTGAPTATWVQVRGVRGG